MEPGKQLLQRLGMADAVLEADDADTRPRVTGNLLCRRLRPRALHGEEDDVRLLQRRRLGREIDEVGREADVPAVLVAEAEAVIGDLLTDAFPADARDLASRRQPRPANDATHRACAAPDAAIGRATWRERV